MSKEYANNQSQGFKNHIQNVAIVGAGGQVGQYIVKHLLNEKKHTVTAITRTESTTEIPQGVRVAKVNYESEDDSLVDALRGQDALIITMGVQASETVNEKIITAAAKAGVAWIIPNWWGNDPYEKEAQEDTNLAKKFYKETGLIEKLGKSSWTVIACGFWYEYSLAAGPWSYGFDFPNKTVTFYDEGETKINTSTWEQTGRAVAKLLSLKILPDDKHDKSTTLSTYKSRPVWVSSFAVSQRDMLESVQRVTGDKDWKIQKESVQERFRAGQAELQGGSFLGFGKLLYARMFYPNNEGFYEKKRGLDNEVLGLPKEDFDEATKFALKIVSDGTLTKRFAAFTAK